MTALPEVEWLRFVVPGSPLSQNLVYRRRPGGYGMFMTQEGKLWIKTIQGHALANRPDDWPLDEVVDLELVHYFSSRRPDSDGPVKLELDALQGILYRKDSQVRDVIFRKRLDAVNPRLEITVWLPREEVAK